MTTEQAITKCFGTWRDCFGRASTSGLWPFLLVVTALFSEKLMLPFGMGAGWRAPLIWGAMLFVLMLPGQDRLNKFDLKSVEVKL